MRLHNQRTLIIRIGTSVCLLTTTAFVLSEWYWLWAFPVAAAGLPSFLVWRFVPKFPRGHFRRCGYNLTGLTEARCPECGTGFEANDRPR